MLKRTAIALLGLSLATASAAKLPPPTPEQQEAAALAAAKTAHANKMDGYNLCVVQTKVAADYVNKQKAAGKSYTPETMAPCVSPGPFVPPAAAKK